MHAEAIAGLGKVLVGDPVVRLEYFDGIFAVGVTSGLFTRIVIDGRYQPELADLCRMHVDPGRDAIDVGANVGFFSAVPAKTVVHGRVLSVKAAHNALQRLYRNIEMNGVRERVLVYEGVASDRDGRILLRTG